MTDTIISSDLSNLTLSTKMVIFGKDGTDTKIDISKMFKDDSEAYIEVTTITKSYGKRFTDWTRLQDTQEYIKELEDILNIADMRCLNKSHKIGVSETSSQVRCLENKKNSKKAKVVSNLIIRKAGRYGGTYLHKKLALKYFRWLDKKFEIAIDLFLEQLYKQITVIKLNRVDTKITFKPLTNAIKDKYLPYNINNRRYFKYPNLAYSDLMDLINIRVLGIKAKAFRKLNNIPDDKSIHTRDYLSELQLKNIKKLQQALYNILEMDILDINDIEKMINKISLITEDNQHLFI